MKAIFSVILSLALLAPTMAHADRALSRFTDLDSFIRECKVSFIGECLRIDETKASAFVYVRKVRVVSALQGAYTAAKEVTVLARTPLLPGHYYLICGEENTKGEVGSWWLEEGEVEIHVAGGDVKTVREAQLTSVLKGLEGISFKEKLLVLFKRRHDQLQAEEQQIKREAEVLGKALKPNGESRSEH
jgi:hypothetical protein